MEPEPSSVPVPERPVRVQTADVLDRLAGQVAEHWLARLEEVYATYLRPNREELLARAPSIVHGIATALREGQVRALRALWTAASRGHAQARRCQAVPPGDLAREYRILRDEIRRALQPHLATIAAADVYDVAEDLDVALDMMAAIAAGPVTAAPKATDEATERRQTEEALRQSEARFRSLVERIGDWVWETDANAVCTYSSPRVRDLLGYEPEEVVGRTPFEFMPEDEARRVAAEFRQVVAERRPFLIDHTELRKDGRPVAIETSGSPIIDEHGVLRGYRGVNRDITERRRAAEERERLLQEVERRAAELDSIIDSAADAILIYGPGGRILRVNTAAERSAWGGIVAGIRKMPVGERAAYLRYQTAEGKPLRPEELPPIRALRGETVRGAILVVQPKAGPAVWLSVSAAPIRRPDGQIQAAVGIYRDITALHQLQEQRDDMLRAVSHDLRSPLTTVLGQAELLGRLLDQAGLTGRERQSAEAIARAGDRMNTMIQDLVDSARQESGQLRLDRQPIDLPSFVVRAKQEQAAAMDVARIDVEAAKGLPLVCADPARLERILGNLLSNALKYSEPGTPVTVSFSRRAGEVITSVADRGRGIPREDLPRLFQRYFRAEPGRERPEGLGLGLYVTRTLVEAHGGHIWVESQVGVGSTFSFSLPVADAQCPTGAGRG